MRLAERKECVCVPSVFEYSLSFFVSLSLSHNIDWTTDSIPLLHLMRVEAEVNPDKHFKSHSPLLKRMSGHVLGSALSGNLPSKLQVTDPLLREYVSIYQYLICNLRYSFVHNDFFLCRGSIHIVIIFP